MEDDTEIEYVDIARFVWKAGFRPIKKTSFSNSIVSKKYGSISLKPKGDAVHVVGAPDPSTWEDDKGWGWRLYKFKRSKLESAAKNGGMNLDDEESYPDAGVDLLSRLYTINMGVEEDKTLIRKDGRLVSP